MAAVILAVGSFYLICYLASLQAAEIFNVIADRQHVFQGKVTVEQLSANIFGRVTFANLVWTNPDGKKIASIPEGYIWVRPWDVVTRNFTTTTIKKVELNDAVINLDFNKDMTIKNVDRTKRKVKTNAKGQRRAVSKEQWETSKIIGRKEFDMKMILNDCVVNAIYEHRNFAMKKVNADIYLNTKDLLNMNFSSGEFEGTIEAKGLNIQGTVDLKKERPVCSLSLNIDACNPASLGTGIDVHEPVTTEAQITGELPDVVIDGTMHMNRLIIPALDFTKVVGFYRYENGVIKASKITANVYGGTVNASGSFNLDTKGYDIDIVGKDLQAMIAAKDPKIKCSVDMNVKIRSDGVPKHTLTYGDFKSGSGSYMLVPFQSISGKFRNLNKVLSFYNVVITTQFGNVTSEAFKIVDGKLKLNTIYLEDPHKGTRQKLR